jgi:hypothetical protein
MRNTIAKVRAANPIWFAGVAMVAVATGLLSGVALHALPVAVAEIVGWIS